jgi:DinB superfamily
MGVGNYFIKALYLSPMGKLYNNFDKLANTWLKALDSYTMEELLRKPSEESWSMGQVFIHITTANKYFLGKNALACANGDGAVTGKGKNKWGWLVFTLNMFPPMNVKMPKKDTGGTEPIQPTSKEEIERKIKENLQLFKEIEAAVLAADPNLRKKYPFLGYLNAKEWYTIGTLHMKHHLRQKKRLDAFLGR